jgi:hypothetical protein
MKQIIIGDTHGHDTWKKILLKEKEFDRFIFIGDYFDSFGITPNVQLENMADIIAFKKANEKKVILLIGNHDYHYWPGIEVYGVSGFQAHMKPTFQALLDANKDLFQMCFIDEYGTVYSHAGFSETFVEMKIGTFSEKQVNDVWKYKPQSFGFYNGDYSHCGDDIHQSCIWIRPQSLYRDAISALQVVGHTIVNQINHPAKSERRGFYMIDALHSGQYLKHEDEKFVIQQLTKEERGLKDYVLPDFYIKN